MKQNTTLRRYRKALAELRKYQDADGSFRNDSGTSFHTSLIMQSLHSLRSASCDTDDGVQDAELLAGMASKGCAFLLKEKSEAWSWNYWKRNSVQAKSKPYPDDMDDTASAIAALSHFKKEAVEEKGLAAFAHLLIAQESAVGGPYQTWIVPTALKEKWSDIDPAVNANVAYALGLHGVELPNLNELFERCMDASDYPSKYYHSPLAVLYFISRAYKGILPDKGISYLLDKMRVGGGQDNILHAALAASALIRLMQRKLPLAKQAEATLRKAMERLEKHIDANSWRAHPFYIEEDKGEVIHSGSVPLTIAFAVESHALCQKYFEEALVRNEQKKQGDAEAKVLKSILDAAKQRFSEMPIFAKKADAMIDAMTRKDPGNQIALLSYHFQMAMKKRRPSSKSLPDPLMLGTANVHGWLAYKIYDDMLDNEGDPLDIPIANIALRESCDLFASCMPGKSLPIMRRILDCIDEANAWERQNCFRQSEDGSISIETLPAYGKFKALAQKSMGHALGPLALLFSAGHSPESAESRAALSFFRNYIIARQLNDDAHDWLEDLERGFINSVSTMLLIEWKKTAAGKDPQLNVTESKKELQKLFWHETIDEACEAIGKHLKLSRKALGSMNALSDKSYLESLLMPIEVSASKALSGRDAAIQFLKSYSL